MSRILLADNQPIIRRAMREKLAEAGHMIVGEADIGWKAMRSAWECRPELMILDLNIVDPDGLSVIRHLRASSATLRLLVYTGLGTSQARACADAGADGFVAKTEEIPFFLDAVTNVLHGRPCFPPLHTAHRPVPREQLSACEQTVLHMFNMGMTTTQIASQLAVSWKTIRVLQAQVVRKLGPAAIPVVERNEFDPNRPMPRRH